ncbi:MAG: DUF4097 domain-containing protein [Defluviitaleaceae bacterium]|nr:DUF4097 domain-containing protein [Defluviitaleaceae bacterium]
MTNEKMKILKLLEEKKITAAEAAKLLESVDGGGAAPDYSREANAQYKPEPPPAADIPTPPGRPGDSASRRPEGSQRQEAPSKSFDDLTGDLGKKFEAFAKDMEPKLQKFTETVAEKIVSGADRLSKSFSAETSPRPYKSEPQGPSSHAAPRAAKSAPASSGFEKNIEVVIAPGSNELTLAGLGADVRVKGYNGDKITAKISYKPKRGGAAIDMVKLGGRYFLKYDEDEFERVAIDAYIPERMFQIINISGIGGNMDISSLAAQEMRFTNANGQTRLAGLGAVNLKAECSNGNLALGQIAADSAIIENFNGNVEVDEADAAKLSLTNFNGALSLMMSSFARHEEYLWSVETSNAKLSINVPTQPDLGYHIKAHTTLGEIRVGLTGLQFLINDPALVEARSSYFDRSKKRVKLTAETSNAQLTIN